MRLPTFLLRAGLLLQIGSGQVLGTDAHLLRHSQDHIDCPSGSRIQRELGPRLSGAASILAPSSPGWHQALVRATSPRINPAFVTSVEPATEQDVQETIKYSNHIGVPFLAVTGTHGWPTTLNDVQGGIQINMRRMNHIELNRDGKTATVGGGVMQHEIVRSLSEQGKMAVTGLCECVSVAGPLLGGGHSMLQGRRGFAADNLASARLVLANGSAVTVSAESSPDLFWAIRGAGHNFGIVTSLEVDVYDVEKTWTMIVLTFTQDKLEIYFSTWNRLEAEHTDVGLLVLNGIFARNPVLDSDHPLVNLQIFYEGENDVADKYTSAFFALGPVLNTTVKDIKYGDLYDVGGFGLTSPVCRKNENILGYPNSLDRWDPDAMRAGFDVFSDLTAPEKFATSAWLLESYGRKAVAAVPAAENAVAPEERSLHLLSSPILWWAGDDEQDRERAELYGKRMQEAVRRGNPALPHTYLNYAVGHEELPEVYGRDVARLAKLKRLKKMYDPNNRFGFYAPIR
ncbi:hypothetical protein B0T25DRAFT_460893 [Lasiosphaeria hispida]|uniref:FAD-binding PCMH-type domain-containing protein n=1 Tax=Lasiosphaeria hispida TaxID=260671 RepID=A0AAJ0HBA2_9PEZI|nr:hypothetical protein B0T25DRAFT_460893 [Lasiosphaeria hispida]